MRSPAVLVAIPLIAGAAIGLSGPGGLSLSGAAGAAVLACLAGTAACLIEDDAGCAGAVVAGCASAGLALGMTAAAAAYAPPLLRWFEGLPREAGESPIELVGVLREDGAPSAFGVTLVLDVGHASLVKEGAGGATAGRGDRAGGVRVTVSGVLAREAAFAWRAGRRVRLVATLRPPATYLDPGVRDERRAMARRGIVLVGGVKSAALVDVVSAGTPGQEAEAASRAWARAAIDAAVGRWSARSAGVAKAVLIGDRTGLSDQDTRRLQDAGTYHVIAISGGNIAVLTAIVFGLLRALGVPGRMSAPACALAIAAYGQAVVPGASVSRAVAAAVLYLLALVLDHRAAAINLLAVAAALGAAAAPVQITDPGFILSFGATLGILLLAPPASTRRAGRPARLARAAGLLGITTIAAEAALAPASAALFSRVTFCGLVLNFVAIPLMTLVQAGALAVLAASRFPAVAAAAGYLVHLSAEGILRSSAFAEALPMLTRDVAMPAWWLLCIYYAAAVAGLLVSGRRRRLAVAVAAAALAVMIASPSWAQAERLPAAGGLRVVCLDVGQADATVVMLPDGRALLVDAGAGPPPPDPEGLAVEGGFDAGARVVVPALRALGVRRLEALVVTHGDPDHLGGAAAVVRALRPRSVWEGVPVPPHAGLQDLRRVADEAGSSWRTVQAGDVEAFGPVTVRVLHPPLPDWERQRVRNEDSIVLEVRLGNVAIVLPGDIGAEGEAAISTRLRPAPRVVLKAPHHGSATSSAEPLLGALAPAAVVFSAGRRSRYGHPAPVVVERYRAHGAAIFSTADDGAVFIDTDGRSLDVRGWRGAGPRWWWW